MNGVVVVHFLSLPFAMYGVSGFKHWFAWTELGEPNKTEEVGGREKVINFCLVVNLV